MKYNAVVHSAVVRNYRIAFKTKNAKESSLTDERIWDITNFYTGLEGGPEAEDEAILERMKEEQID